MTKKPRALNISLGVEFYTEYKQALERLAVCLNFPGRDGKGSVSQLMIHLARAYIAEPDIAKLIDAAFVISGGADWDETVENL